MLSFCLFYLCDNVELFLKFVPHFFPLYVINSTLVTFPGFSFIEHVMWLTFCPVRFIRCWLLQSVQFLLNHLSPDWGEPSFRSYSLIHIHTHSKSTKDLSNDRWLKPKWPNVVVLSILILHYNMYYFHFTLQEPC